MNAPLGNAHNLRWATSHDVALAKHLGDDKSMAETAKALNIEFGTEYSRNAIIGRANRLGLKSNVPKSQGSKRQARYHGGEKPKYVRKIVVKKPPVFKCDTATGLRVADVVPRMIPLVDLEPGGCRWPYGDGPFVFCGLPDCVGSYCEAHQALSAGDMRGRGEKDEAMRAIHRKLLRPAVYSLNREYSGEDTA